jgi:hypothetical protein
MNRRLVFFLLSIVIGISLGLVYGWMFSPVEVVDTAPNTFRVDYKTDYVLMVAEIFADEQDLDAAVYRLASLGGEDYANTVREAMVFAVSYGFAPNDLAHLQNLLNALEANPSVSKLTAQGGV